MGFSYICVQKSWIETWNVLERLYGFPNANIQHFNSSGDSQAYNSVAVW